MGIIGLGVTAIVAVVIFIVLVHFFGALVLLALIASVPIVLIGAAWRIGAPSNAAAVVDRANDASHRDDETSPATEVVNGRPAWVDAPPSSTVKVYRRTLVVGPYSTIEECAEQLRPALRDAATEYIEHVVGSDATEISLPDADLRGQVVRELWQEPFQSSVGPMVKLHALLEFDSAMQKQVEQLWRTARIHDRLRYVGAAMAGVLLCLSGAHVWLRPSRSVSTT
jgi:hypothetical protein